MMDATKSCFLRKFLSELSCFLQNLLTREPGPCRILVLAERFEVGTALSTLRVAQSDGMKLREHPFLYQERRSWRLAGSC
jgi:hypothetical protein